MKRTSKLRRKSLRPLAKLKQEAWRAYANFVKNRDNWTCITCGKYEKGSGMNAGHFVHGDRMDFVDKNINAQCVRCNKWLHGNLGVYAVKIDERYGNGTAKRLLGISRTYGGLRRKDFEEIIAKYEKV